MARFDAAPGNVGGGDRCAGCVHISRSRPWPRSWSPRAAPARAHRAPAVPAGGRRSASSSSGPRRPSSPATSPPTSRATSRPRGSTSDGCPAAARRRPAAVGSAPGRARVHDLVGAEGPRGPRGGLRPRRHRPGLPALRHAVGRLEGQRASPTPAVRPARRSASGTSATSSRSRPGCDQLRPDAGPRERRRSGHAVPEGHPGFDMVAFLLNARSTWPRR